MKVKFSQANLRKAIFACTILALILSGFVAYQYEVLRDELSLVEEGNQDLLTKLDAQIDENNYLLEKNRNQQTIIDSFGGQIADIGSTVGDLEKLANTDPELLQKYSKIYFLNENYVPSGLVEIDAEYTHTDNGNFFIQTQVRTFLENLLLDARRSGVELLVASAFRSFDTQATLKAGYAVTYGSGANQFSADQGYSEHQLGTSVDFTTPETGVYFSRFKDTGAYEWLLDNAHRYGFILSYPEGNSYYKFEPWHWRFVGVELASNLYDDGKYFYDLSQRDIDRYLIKIFD